MVGFGIIFAKQIGVLRVVISSDLESEFVLMWFLVRNTEDLVPDLFKVFIN